MLPWPSLETNLMRLSWLKSILLNLGVVIVGFGFAFVGTRVDVLLGIGLGTPLATDAGWIALTIGFLLRVWATYDFYEQHMKVISLAPQRVLITSGPYRFTRNPLYLGGNGFIFLGAVLVLGSPAGVVLTVINIFAVDLMIRREERQLEKQFGGEWVSYRNRVRRWL
jgi:protein-S-isoprenylcysteine O-methyltransferase Ste14